MTTKKIKVPTLKHETIVKLEVSGFFHMMAQSVLMGLAQQSKPEDFAKALDKLKTGQPPSNVFEGEIQVLTILINSIEEAAKKQNLITENEVEIDEDTKAPTGN